MSAENEPRLADSVNYFFTSPTGEVLTLIDTTTISPTKTWYRFVYSVLSNIHTIDVDSDLNVRSIDSVTAVEPYVKINFQLPEIRLSLMVHTNSAEDFFRGTAKVHISESQELGLLNTDNYNYAERLLGDRLLGGINLKIVRTTIGIDSVEACVVNQGQIPVF